MKTHRGERNVHAPGRRPQNGDRSISRRLESFQVLRRISALARLDRRRERAPASRRREVGAMNRRAFVVGMGGVLAMPHTAAAFMQERTDGVVFLPDPIFYIHLQRMATLCAAARLPETRRSPRRRADEVRAGHQPQDRQGARLDDPAVAPAPQRSDDRVIGTSARPLIAWRKTVSRR